MSISPQAIIDHVQRNQKTYWFLLVWFMRDMKNLKELAHKLLINSWNFLIANGGTKGIKQIIKNGKRETNEEINIIKPV